MDYDERIIHIHPLAPPKPQVGSDCNGCGVCCLVAPCPLGMVLSRKRRGGCDALRWNPQGAHYRCGAVEAPQDVLAHAFPLWLGWLASALAPALRRLALRWIAAGRGCDSSLETASRVSPTIPSPNPASTQPSAAVQATPHD